MVRKLRTIGVAPAGDGLKQALKKYVTTDAVITATNSAKLLAIRDCLADTDFFGVDLDCELITYDDLVGRCLLSLNKPRKLSAPAVLMEDLIANVAATRDEGTLLGRARRQRGLAKAIHRSIQDLHQNGVEVNGLAGSLIADSPDVDLAKLRELGDFESALKERLSALNLSFVSEGVRTCMESEEKYAIPIQNLIVFIGAGADSLPIEFFKWISDCGVPVTLFVDQVRGRGDLFQNVVRISQITGASVHPPEGAWYDVLFTSGRADTSPSLHQIAAANPQIECEVGMRRLKERHAKGVAFEEMAVYCRRNEMLPLVESASRLFEVPIRCVRRERLQSNGFIGLLVTMIEVIVRSDFARLGEIGRSSYVREDIEETLLEDIAREVLKAGERSWQVLRALVDATGVELPWMDALMHWREDVRFTKRSVREWSESVREFVDASLLIEGVAAQVSPTLDRDMGALRNLQFELEAFSVANPDLGEVDIEQFLKILRSVIRTGTFVLRTGDGGVTVATSGEELSSFNTVLLLNMVEGNLPRRRSEDSILWDTDLDFLSRAFNLKVKLENSVDRARLERDEFFRVISAAKEHLIVSYSEISDDRENIPTAYLDELRSTVAVEATHERVLTDIAAASLSSGMDPEQMTERERTVAHARQLPKLEPKPAVLKLPKAIELASIPEGPVQPEVIQSFLECPFRATLRHRFRISAGRRESRIWVLRRAIEASGVASIEDLEDARLAFRAALEDALDDVRTTMDQSKFIALQQSLRQMAAGFLRREFEARSAWGARTIESGVELGAEFGRGSMPLANGERAEFVGLKYDLREYTDGRRGVLVAHPGVTVADKGEMNSYQLLGELIFCLTFKRGENLPSVELDDLVGERVLLYGREDHYPRREAGIGLKYQAVEWNIKQGNREKALTVAGWVQEGLDRARKNTMLATPDGYQGDPEQNGWRTGPCYTCYYGEVCRVEKVEN